MISEQILAILQKDIQIYDKINNKDYLIAFSIGKNREMKYCQVTFTYNNFWHLLGCSINKRNTTPLDAYIKCKNQEDISDDVNYVHSFNDSIRKHAVFEKIFDFVSNAKLIKIGYISDCPEQYALTMSMGNNIGIVGYDYPKNKRSDFMIPKSVQNKKISQVTKTVNKILFILSKNIGETSYKCIEYEIKKDIINNYLEELSRKVPVSI